MRLIDADALRAAMYHEAFETDTDMQKWDGGCWIRYKMFENNIDKAPTIEPERLNVHESQKDADCISRQAAIDALSCENPTETYIDYDDAVKAIRRLPSAQPERKTGQWHGTVCSVCGESTPFFFDCKYCPNCGCKMEVEHD